MIKRKCALLLVFFMAGIFFVKLVVAGDIALKVLPQTIGPMGSVTITLTCEIAPSTVNTLTVTYPPPAVIVCTPPAGVLPISLPSVGSSYSIQFPIDPVLGAWVGFPGYPLPVGTYTVASTGVEGLLSFTVTGQFAQTPEFEFGTIIAVATGFISLIWLKRRFTPNRKYI